MREAGTRSIRATITGNNSGQLAVGEGIVQIQNPGGSSIPPKIKVLFLAANPVASRPLMLDKEIREIEAKIRASKYRDTLELVSQWAVSPDDLQQALLVHRPQIVHFSGHGNRDGALMLGDHNGIPTPVGKAALIGLFRILKDNLRLVLLNACHSESQAEAIAEDIDCTIGMGLEIGDEAARTFAASFYRTLGFGRSVRTAFELGIGSLQIEDIPGETTPRLFVRKGLDASTLILVPSP